jgi:uncharacterized protein
MPTEPFQLVLVTLELGLLATGVGLGWRILARPDARQRWLGTNQLSAWPITLGEFAFLVVLVGLGAVLTQSVLQTAFGSGIKQAVDRAGLEVLLYGGGFHVGALLGWLVFPFVRKTWYADYGTLPPSPPPLTTPPAPPLPWSRAALIGAGVMIISLPLLGALSAGWNFLLRSLGHAAEPQDLLAIFAETRSPLVIAGMLTVACVIAPLSEELLFRAGLYRFTRQQLGRPAGLLISGALFGVLHGNLAGFLPLAVLGGLLALAYEATGSLRVVIIAHGLFNLNTILLILAGLTPDA